MPALRTLHSQQKNKLPVLYLSTTGHILHTTSFTWFASLKQSSHFKSSQQKHQKPAVFEVRHRTGIRGKDKQGCDAFSENTLFPPNTNCLFYTLNHWTHITQRFVCVVWRLKLTQLFQIKRKHRYFKTLSEFHFKSMPVKSVCKN